MKTKIEIMMDRYNQLEKEYKSSSSMLSSKMKIKKLEEMLEIRKMTIMYLLSFYVAAFNSQDDKMRFLLSEIEVEEE